MPCSGAAPGFPPVAGQEHAGVLGMLPHEAQELAAAGPACGADMYRRHF